MATAVPKARKLSSIVKCGRCRQDRQKCERPDVSQKCLRCARYNHECDSGRASNRAQHSQRVPARRRVTPGKQSAVNREPLAGNLSTGSIDEELKMKVEESSSSQTSRSDSSELSSPWSTSDRSSRDSQQLTHRTNSQRFEFRHDSASSLNWDSGTKSVEGNSSISELDAPHVLDPGGWREAEFVQEAVEKSDGMEKAVSNVVPTVVYVDTSGQNVQFLSGLTSIRPSRNRSLTPFEERLDARIDRLWGNYKTFATANAKGLRVSPLFGRTLSELFRQSKQIAEMGDDLVADVRYACGAADACMNRKLPEKIRAQFLEAYHRYDARANIKYHRAVNEFAKKVAEDESPDVLPLYIATFLYYAAGACMRGADDLIKATFAFKYFNQYTALFPIRIKILPVEDGTWATDMLLANNSEDPGMRINTLMFALGKARLEFDRQEGLC